MQHLEVADWINKKALPLWTSSGVDAATGAVWEALDHDGVPCADLNRRLRVQARQAFSFATSEDPSHRALALQLFRFAMDNGFDPETGNLAANFSPEVQIVSAPHDLYDLAFMLLAAAALIEAGFDIRSDLRRLEAELAKLKAPRGWYENKAHDLPRRQNPHMHVFEAATALYRVTGVVSFRTMAAECLSLLQECFLTPDGLILEYFDADWRPLVGKKQVVEPGHMAEWIYLIDRYEDATGRSSEVPLETLYAAVLARRDSFGFLPDRSDPATNTRRMWPQTELLKATLVMRHRKVVADEAETPDVILSRIQQEYLESPIPGGWYDSRTSDGELLSVNMPASTFYHIIVALRFYLSQDTSV
ncbi:MAG: AGE family epimerase/isomerase [Sulfitobacter sp.]